MKTRNSCFHLLDVWITVMRLSCWRSWIQYQQAAVKHVFSSQLKDRAEAVCFCLKCGNFIKTKVIVQRWKCKKTLFCSLAVFFFSLCYMLSWYCFYVSPEIKLVTFSTCVMCLPRGECQGGVRCILVIVSCLSLWTERQTFPESCTESDCGCQFSKCGSVSQLGGIS